MPRNPFDSSQQSSACPLTIMLCLFYVLGEKLAKAWKDDKVGLVAEVDCTAEGQPLCEANDVQGFPTLKWGDPSNLEEYEGGRDFNSLSKFAKTSLKPMCSPKNLDLCDKEQKAVIEKYLAMPKTELDALIEAEKKKLKDAEEKFTAEVERLQAEYQALMDGKAKTVAAVKAGGLGLMKSVSVARANDGKKDEL